MMVGTPTGNWRAPNVATGQSPTNNETRGECATSTGSRLSPTDAPGAVYLLE